MGGEKSKNIGEFGEKKVNEFLELIGWNNPRKGVAIDCLDYEKHSKSETQGTHGIDFGFTYLSKLNDSHLVDVCISVKATEENYPPYPSTNFKKHIIDLSDTIECYKKSPERSEFISSFKNYNEVENIGVLFWITTNLKPNKEFLLKLNNVRLTNENNFEIIYVVDNDRYNFITKSINYSKNKFQNCNVTFHYPNTGKNLNPITKKSNGHILPVEYINSSVLAIHIEDQKTSNNFLLLSCIDDFNITILKRLIGLAQNLSSNWASKIYIGFSDFDEYKHSLDVQSALGSFEDEYIKKYVEIVNFN